jgi:hypothetical protein
VDLVVNIQKAILNSENPGGLTHMRSTMHCVKSM